MRIVPKLLCLLGGAGLALGSSAFRPEPRQAGPSLPLPRVTTKRGRPASNSVRAWHYKPGMVEPLRRTIQAIFRGSVLGRRRITQLMAIVSAINRCFY